MSNFKKVISAGLGLAIALGAALPAAAYRVAPDIAGTQYEEAAQVLGALNIMIGDDTGNFRPNDTVSRAEFAKIAVHALGLEEVAKTSQGTSVFPDVPVNHWANGYINVATAQKIIIGDENGYFNPSDGISYQEAVTILIRVLGYEPAAKLKGQYPASYLAQANEIGLTKKTSAPGTSEASRGISCQLTYNSLGINLMEATGIGSGTKYEVTDKTLLTDKLGTEKKNGVVTGNSITKLNGTSTLSDGRVEIDGNVYFSGNSGVDRLLGFNTEYYVKKQDNGDKTVILARPDKSKNGYITIDAEDLASEIKEGDTQISYYPDEDSGAESVTLSDKVNVIYNDKAGMLTNPKTGTVTVLDTTRDEIYDTVFINEYVNYVVDDVSSSSKRIFDKYDNQPLELDTQSNKKLKVIIEDTDGEAVNLNDIKEWDVLSVFKNTDYVRAVVSRDSVSGKISEISTNEHKVSVNSESYEIAENLDFADFHLDMEGNFYIDMNGKIAGYDARSTKGSQYGYIINAGTTKGIDKKLEIKMVNDKGVASVFTAANKLKIDNVAGYDAEDALSELKSGRGSVTPFMVSYELDGDGNITYIDRAEDKSSAFPESFKKEMFALNFTGDGLIYKAQANKLNIVNEKGNTSGSVGIDADTVIFVAQEGETNTENIKVGDRKLLSDGNAYDVEVYDMADNMTAGVIRIKSAVSSVKLNSSVAVVDKITTVTGSDGQAADKLYVYTDGKSQTFITQDSDTLIKETGKKLENGDIIQYTLNGEGKINGYTLLFEAKDKSEEFVKHYGNDNKMTTVYGRVTKRFADSINVSVEGEGESNYVLDGITVYKYDSNKTNNKITTGAATDIVKWENGSHEERVFLRIYDDKLCEVVIIK